MEENQIERRSQDNTSPTTRDRLVRLESVNDKLHSDLNRLHEDMYKMDVSYNNHKESTLAMFVEINKSLATVDSTVKNMAVSISDLKEIVKDLKETQSTVSRDVDVLRAMANTVNDINSRTATYNAEQCKLCQVTLADYREFKASTRATWKTVTVVAIAVSFIWGASWTVANYIATTHPTQIVQQK